jgi:hypothetical protein
VWRDVAVRRRSGARIAYDRDMRGWLVIVIAGCQFSADPVADDAMHATGVYRISGHAFTVGISGQMSLSGVRVDALGAPDSTTPIASAETAADGGYEITVPNGAVGVLHAQATSYFDTYLYPQAALSTDAAGLDTVMMTADTFSLLSNLIQVTQDLSKGWIAVRVVDERNMPLANASIDANGVVCYTGPTGLPMTGGTGTQADGAAYVFNTPVGSVDISVLHTGMPFALRSIPTRAQSVTLAFIGPGQAP